MTQSQILFDIEQRLSKLYDAEPTGHDFYHLQRVVHTTKEILKTQQCDYPFLCTTIAWVHDLGDYKLNDNQDRSQQCIDEFLRPYNLPVEQMNFIIRAVAQIGYKGGRRPTPDSMEAKIVQDADRLDALGAIGIARTFAYGGVKGNLLYKPDASFKKSDSFEAYKNATTSTIHHFYDKLLLLKDLLHTDYAKKEAERKHDFMLQFLKEFYQDVRA